MLRENTRSPAAASAEAIVSPAYPWQKRPFQVNSSSSPRLITSPDCGGRRIARVLISPPRWPPRRARSWRRLPGRDASLAGPGLPDLVGLGVPLHRDEPAAAHPVVPALGGPATRVGPEVEVAAPLRGRCAARVRARGYLADVRELGRLTRAAPGTWQEDHHRTFPHQWPTAAAPFSPTSAPSPNRSRPKAAMIPGVSPDAMHCAMASPDTGPALNP